MKSFNVNTVKSILGRNVNLHLKDGSVIVNVNLTEIQRDDLENEAFLRCVPYGKDNSLRIPLRNVAWAELLNINLIQGCA